jgi:cytochrome c oxidase subunit 4
MSDPSNINNPEHENHHIVTPLTYFIIYITLLVCTGLTVFAAYQEFGIFNPIIAVGIACFKGCLVLLWFMHLKYSSKLVKLTVFSGFTTFLVLIVMTLLDYFTRAWGRW